VATTRWAPWRVALLALVAGGAIYARGLGGAFVLDDRTYFIENDDIPTLGWKGAITVFTRPTNFWGELLPVRDLLLLAEYGAFGRSTTGYHVVSLLLYAAVCALAFMLVRELLERRSGPEASAGSGGALSAVVVVAVFLVHPVHVETVAYITGQKDLLSSIFALGALLLFARAFDRREGRGPRLALAAGLYYLAILSKLTTVGLAALVPVLYLVSDPERRPGAVRAALAWVAVNVPVLLWFRWALKLAAAGWSTTSAINDLPFLDRLPVALKILGAHTRLALWPHPLSFGYPFDGSPAPDGNMIAGVLALAAIGAILVVYRREPAVVFGGALYLLFLAPVLQLTGSTNNASIYDRYLFLPVLGLAVIVERVGRSLARGPAARRALVAGLVVAIGAGAWRSAAYVPAFADDVAVVRNTYERFPGWTRSGFELAYSLVEARRLDEARRLLSNEPSLASPEWVRPYFEGGILLAEGRATEAVQVLWWAQQLALTGGYFPFPSVPLGAALLQIGRLDEAERQLRTAVESPIYMPLEVYHARALLSDVQQRRAGLRSPR